VVGNRAAKATVSTGEIPTKEEGSSLGCSSRAVARERQRRSGIDAEMLDHLSHVIAEDW
jgi:hypothetical protein